MHGHTSEITCCIPHQVETVGDKYMLASGLPEKNSVHAKSIALVALDMIDIVRDIVVYEQPVRVSGMALYHNLEIKYLFNCKICSSYTRLAFMKNCKKSCW